MGVGLVLSHRFKRIGANAMKGRGIGSARGRATIQRAQSESWPIKLTRASAHLANHNTDAAYICPHLARCPFQTAEDGVTVEDEEAGEEDRREVRNNA